MNLIVRTGRLFHTHSNLYNDWVIGSFVKDPDFNSNDFEFKFQKGEKGLVLPLKDDSVPQVKTFPILMYGAVKVSFNNGCRHVFLRNEGDYVLFEPNEAHELEFLEDSLIVTLRWKYE